MNWIETPESSNISRFRYVSESSTLEIDFRRGGTYQYFEVPESIFSQMQAAASKGQFFAQNIKGVFRYARA